MPKYSLDVKDNGTTVGDFRIYQVNDDPQEDTRSLVWFKKTAHPRTPLHFEWNVDYGFVWSETGALEPGIVFQASEVNSAGPMDTCLDGRIPKTEIQEAVHKYLDNAAPQAKNSHAQ